MGNPWELDAEMREECRKVLASMSAALVTGEQPKHPALMAWHEAIIQSHASGEVEMGAILGVTWSILRRGGEEGRDRTLAALFNILADYEPATRPDLRRN